MVKKDNVESASDMVDCEGANAPPSSPPKMLKRKRRKSRTVDAMTLVKDKRKLKKTTNVVANTVDGAAIAADGDDMAVASTSASKAIIQGRSPLIKTNKLIRKKKTVSLLKKAKRPVLPTE